MNKDDLKFMTYLCTYRMSVCPHSHEMQWTRTLIISNIDSDLTAGVMEHIFGAWVKLFFATMNITRPIRWGNDSVQEKHDMNPTLSGVWCEMYFSLPSKEGHIVLSDWTLVCLLYKSAQQPYYFLITSCSELVNECRGHILVGGICFDESQDGS